MPIQRPGAARRNRRASIVVTRSAAGAVAGAANGSAASSTRSVSPPATQSLERPRLKGAGSRPVRLSRSRKGACAAGPGGAAAGPSLPESPGGSPTAGEVRGALRPVHRPRDRGAAGGRHRASAGGRLEAGGGVARVRDGVLLAVDGDARQVAAVGLAAALDPDGAGGHVVARDGLVDDVVRRGGGGEAGGGCQQKACGEDGAREGHGWTSAVMALGRQKRCRRRPLSGRCRTRGRSSSPGARPGPSGRGGGRRGTSGP